jgi:hypothetical protein
MRTPNEVQGEAVKLVTSLLTQRKESGLQILLLAPDSYVCIRVRALLA